jgi:glycosyltransferase involved in cell wall biosynthesis
MSSQFSVVIPAKGDCEYLIETLESIIPSTLKPSEILLVDDGIHPKIKSQLTNFHGKLPLRLIPNAGSGLVDALNTGLKSSTSTYIARLDADDLVTFDRFKKQVDFLAANPNVAAVGGQVFYIDSNGKLIGNSEYKSGRVDNCIEFKSQCMLAHPAVMMNKLLANKSGGYRSICTNGRVDLAEDFDLWLRLSKVGEIHNLPDSILFYRQHAGQISSLHTSTQMFATQYVAYVHHAENLNSFFRYEKLLLKSFNYRFISRSFKTLQGYVPFRSRFLLILEGSLIYFNVGDSLYSRIVRKAIRATSGHNR